MVSMMAQTSVLQLEVKVEGAHKAAQQLVHPWPSEKDDEKILLQQFLRRREAFEGCVRLKW